MHGTTDQHWIVRRKEKEGLESCAQARVLTVCAYVYLLVERHELLVRIL